MAKFTDSAIRELIHEKKFLRKGWTKKIQLKDTRSGQEGSIKTDGEYGNKFRIIVKKSKFDNNNFCLTFGVYPIKSKILFRLLRYDGSSHAHTNKCLRGDRIQFIEYKFHIHVATERYQDMGLDEDYYAEPTDKYDSLNGALDCLLEDSNFILPEGETGSLLRRLDGLWN